MYFQGIDLRTLEGIWGVEAALQAMEDKGLLLVTTFLSITKLLILVCIARCLSHLYLLPVSGVLYAIPDTGKYKRLS